MDCVITSIRIYQNDYYTVAMSNTCANCTEQSLLMCCLLTSSHTQWAYVVIVLQLRKKLMQCNKSQCPPSPIVPKLNLKVYHYHKPIYHTKKSTSVGSNELGISMRWHLFDGKSSSHALNRPASYFPGECVLVVSPFCLLLMGFYAYVNLGGRRKGEKFISQSAFLCLGP